MSDLTRLFVAIGASDRELARRLLEATPSLATAGLARTEELFLADRFAQMYEGDTALHATACSYDIELAQQLVGLGADIRARNRRGAEPLHSATMGNPTSDLWDPAQQRAITGYLLEVGADPDARAAGGVTPLHRAVRNRCSPAVEVLLSGGADPRLENDNGSTALDLARWTTGRGGSGDEAARAEQAIIVDLLERVTS